MTRKELWDRAWAYFKNNRYEECIRDCNKLINQGEMLFDVRASCLLALEMYDEAISDCDMAITLKKDNDWAYSTRAQSFIKISDSANNDQTRQLLLAKALDDSSTVISLKNDRYYHYVQRSEIYHRLRNYPKALNDINRAILLSKNEPDSGNFLWRALFYINMFEFKKALEDYRKVEQLGISLDSYNLYRKAFCYYNLEDYVAAKETLNAYYKIAGFEDPFYSEAEELRAQIGEKRSESSLNTVSVPEKKTSSTGEKQSETKPHETGFSKIVLKIAAENGKGVFLEPGRLKSLLLDYTKNDYKKENSFLLAVLETDCVQYINRAENFAECKQFLIKRLDDEYGLSPSKSAEMLDLLFLVLRGKKIKPSVTESVTVKPSKTSEGDYSRKIERGTESLKKEEYDQAIADFTQAIRLDPNNAEAYSLRGSAYFNKRDFDRAIADCTQVIRLDPSNSAAYFLRVGAYVNKKDYDRAIADCTQAIRLVDHNLVALAYKLRGEMYFYKEDYDRAIADCTQAIADCTQIIRLSDPNFVVRAYELRGKVYFNKEDYDRAIADYTQAIRLDPNDDEAYSWRGVAYSGKKDYDRAIANCTQAIKLDPNNAVAYSLRGNAYFEKKDYDRAIANCTQAIKLDPNAAGVYFMRGRAYFEKKDYTQAITDFTQAISLDPADYTQEIKLDFKAAGVYFMRGKAYFEKKEYDRAIADYTQAISLNPNDNEDYFHRGNAFFEKKDYNQAIKDYEAALRIKPDYDDAKKSLENCRKHIK